MDPQLICGISSQAEENTFDDTGTESTSKNQLRRLDLQWSGNNTVLRAWSEPEGLPMLQNLQTISIKIPESMIVSKASCYSAQNQNYHWQCLNFTASLDNFLGHELTGTDVRLSQMDPGEEKRV